MAATTTLLGLVTPTQGTLTGTWGDTVNYGISDYLDIAIAGTLSFAGDGAITLANTTGSSSGNSIGATTAQYAIIKVTGTLTTAKIITGPSYSKTYLVVNAATGSTVTFKASGQTGVSIAVGETALVYYNGTDYVKVVGTATAGAAGGSTTQVQYNNAGVLAGITGATTNGTALTLVAPVLGTPASGTVTNLTGTASININGTVGATTATTGAFTTVTTTGNAGIGTTAAGSSRLAVVATSLSAATFTQTGATGYGVAIVPGADTVYDAFSINNAANTLNNIQMYGNGSARFAGLVTAQASLAVTGTLSATGTLSGGTSGTAYSFSGSAPATSLTLDSSGNLKLGVASTGIQASDGYTMLNQTTTVITIGATNRSLAFATSASATAAILDTSGNLGLGVTPSAWDSLIKVLELNNGVSFGAQTDGEPVLYIGVNNYYGAGADRYKVSSKAATRYRSNAGEHAWFNAPSGTAGNAISFTQAMTLDASGNLGIGTTTITSTGGWTPRLVLADATAPAMILKGPNSQEASIGSANGLFIDCLGNTTGTNNNIIFRNTSGNSSFTATERARIDSSGNLLVGTTSFPASITAGGVYKTTIADYVYSFWNANASPYGIFIKHDTDANNTGNEFLVAYGLSTLRNGIRSNGGIANYSANNVNLSDRREKTNFAPATSYLDKICAIPVQTFNYIDQNLEEDGGLTLGVVAQDVQAVAPELVMESNWASKDEEPKMRLSIYQTDLQYALMKCIQEQQALITQLTARITALETA